MAYKKKLSQETIDKIVLLGWQGYSVAEIQKETGVHVSSIRRHLIKGNVPNL